MRFNQKLYLISRRDFPPGSQAVQACHAFREFIARHSELEAEWFSRSNHLCFLSVENEKALVLIMQQAIEKKFRWASFQEPDLGMAYTAVALEPSDDARAFCAALPLALTEYVETE